MTPILGMPELTEGQAIPEATVNEIARILEQGAGWFRFLDRDLTAPPGGPSEGDCYLVGGSATGAWATHDGEIAHYLNGAWEFIDPQEGMGAGVLDENVAVAFLGGSWVELAVAAAPVLTITVALSDLTTNLTTGANKAYWDPPFPMTVLSVSAAVFEAPTGAAIVIDVNEAGVSILSTKISIDDGEVRSADSATPPVISDSTVSGRLTFDIDQVGSTNAGKGAQVTIEYQEL